MNVALNNNKIDQVLMMKNGRVLLAAPLLFSMLSPSVYAEPLDGPGEGDLSRFLFGNALQQYGIDASVLLDVGYGRNNRSTHKEREHGNSNAPIPGQDDEGFELQSLQLFIDKNLNSNILPRVTPLPGPTPKDFDFGFSFGTLYGRNAQFPRTFGWDAHWEINEPGATDSEYSKRHRQNYLAVQNLFATAYLPYATGITLWAGIFGPAIGYEIGPNLREARNNFTTKTYAFISEPNTLSGVMAGTRLYSGEAGMLGMELGLVRGWNNLRDNNDTPSVNGALRWRTSDMQTWVDYEFIVGNEQNDSFGDVQAPSALIVSPRGQLKQQHSLNGWHAFNSQWSMGAEAVYGRQEGDGRPDTVDIVRGPGFSGAEWWGVNANLTYQYRKNLSFSGRIEHFDDKEGFILYPLSAARGAINSVTTGVRYDVSCNLSLRPEIRYDWQADSSDKTFGNGRNQSQLTGVVEALFYF